MTIRIHNSLTGRKQELKPLRPGEVRMYLCGDTVYDFCHIGHARSKVAFDIVRRYLLHRGLAVTFVRNITDIDDKIIRRAVENGETIRTLTDRFIAAMHEDADALGVARPDHEPRATGYVPQMLSLIGELESRGLAYRAGDGDVNYPVRRFAPYGRLSGKSLDDLRAGERVAVDSAKQDPLDFVLWKAAKPGEPDEATWRSDYGPGRPGWHIECSAMATKYLGAQFDIHGGGMDLLFPHHESEIAQSTICNHIEPVRYWMHNNMITINGRKMGKSYNNVIKLTELFSGTHPELTQAYHPMTVRFFILQSHYRSTLDFSNEALQAAEKGLKRLWEAYAGLQSPVWGGTRSDQGAGDVELDQRVNRLLDEIGAFVNDDFNTAKALANLFELVPVLNSVKDGMIAASALSVSTIDRLRADGQTWIEDIFGLQAVTEADNQKLKGVMDLLIEIRKEAKGRKDFATSDKIRDQLIAMGIQLKDEKGGGTSWTIDS